MSDKHTITLYPPEYGAEPHIPIEVTPDQVKQYLDKDWRTEAMAGVQPQEPEHVTRRRNKTKQPKPPAQSGGASKES